MLEFSWIRFWMPCVMAWVLSLLVVAVPGQAAALAPPRAMTPSYPRPAFDKAAHRGTVWSTANPWWPPNLSHREFWWGGPDHSWDTFSSDRVTMWKEVAERYHTYGLTGLQMETARYVMGARETAEGFAASGTGMTVVPFMQVHGANVSESIDFLLQVFGRFENELWEHPGFYRLSGRPVVFLYLATRYEGEDWKKIISAVEAVHGSMIWLFDGAMVGIPPRQWPERVRDLMGAFDGVSMYANWSTATQEALYQSIGALIREEFPEKIFEGGVHTNYTNHHWYGGTDPHLTSKYRQSWAITTQAKPDAITVTNWFDILENSRIMPSHEQEDVLLRLLQYFAAEWRGQPLPATREPLLYAAWPTHTLLGQSLDYELLIFPCEDPAGNLQAQLELWTGDDRRVRTFLPREELGPLDRLQVFRFSIDAQELKDELGIFPRLRYRWHDQWTLTEPFPHTHLATSIRSRLMYWARSNRRSLPLKVQSPWRMNATPAGGVMTWQPDQRQVVIFGSGENLGTPGLPWGDQARVLRNWRDYREVANEGLNFNMPMEVISPGATLDWYNLELTGASGHRYLSKPIWVHDGSRDRPVTLPIYDVQRQEVRQVTVQDYRVPFFQYDCAFDAGQYLIDGSGNEHHGSLDQSFRRGGLYRTSYRYEHTGKMPAWQQAQARYEADYQGHPALVFDGTGVGVLMGGTAFPYSFTYEMWICPDTTAKEQVFLAAGNGQINLALLAGGRLVAWRGSATEGAGGEKLAATANQYVARVVSKSTLPEGAWSHVAVVYDLEHLKLYVNGVLEQQSPMAPNRQGEWINPLIVGGACRFPYWGIPQFVGGIRHIRLYGRPLAPEEFLFSDH